MHNERTQISETTFYKADFTSLTTMNTIFPLMYLREFQYRNIQELIVRTHCFNTANLWIFPNHPLEFIIVKYKICANLFKLNHLERNDQTSFLCDDKRFCSTKWLHRTSILFIVKMIKYGFTRSLSIIIMKHYLKGLSVTDKIIDNLIQPFLNEPGICQSTFLTLRQSFFSFVIRYVLVIEYIPILYYTYFHKMWM